MAPPIKTTGLRLTRRAAVGGTAALAGALVPGKAIANAAAAVPPRPRFFTRGEWALLDELSEIIIPTDEQSPGARAAGVAADIDRRLAELVPRIPAHAEMQARWKAGLRLVETLAAAQGGKPSGQGPKRSLASHQARNDARTSILTKVLTTMAAGEAKPTTTAEKFFVECKAMVAASYYTTEIGIKQEIGYKGNTYFDEFQGHDPKSVPARVPTIVPVGAVKKR